MHLPLISMKFCSEEQDQVTHERIEELLSHLLMKTVKITIIIYSMQMLLILVCYTLTSHENVYLYLFVYCAAPYFLSETLNK